MTITKWSATTSPESILTTELNSLANGATKLSAAVSNDDAAERNLYADFEFTIAAQGSARANDAHVQLYLLPSIDGTNFTYGDDSTTPPASALVGSFILDASTSARVVHLRGVELPPEDFKLLVYNNTGQALAASGNTLKLFRYNLETS